jgi:hypothetical protein
MFSFDCGLFSRHIVVALSLQFLIAVGVESKEALVAFEEGIHQVQSVGSLILITLGNGDIAVCDGDGRIVARNKIDLKEGQFPIIIPSASLLLVVSNQWYYQSSFVDRVCQLLGAKSQFDLYRFGDSV